MDREARKKEGELLIFFVVLTGEALLDILIPEALFDLDLEKYIGAEAIKTGKLMGAFDPFFNLSRKTG